MPKKLTFNQRLALKAEAEKDILVKLGWKKLEPNQYSLLEQGVTSASREWAVYIQKILVQNTWTQLT